MSQPNSRTPEAGAAQPTGAAAAAKSAPGPIEIRLCSDPRLLAVVRSAVERMALGEGFTPDTAQQVAWALDEALSNVIRHAYAGEPDQPIHVRMESSRTADGGATLSLVVRDFGPQVDPASICGRDLSDVRPGGLGVHVIRSVMDEAEYTRAVEGGMQLRMVKRRPPAGAG